MGDATPANPMTGWTQAAFTSVAQQDDMGTYVDTCVKTLVFNKVCLYFCLSSGKGNKVSVLYPEPLFVQSV